MAWWIRSGNWVYGAFVLLVLVSIVNGFTGTKPVQERLPQQPAPIDVSPFDLPWSMDGWKSYAAEPLR